MNFIRKSWYWIINNQDKTW